jgi:protein-L-isoaspartate(D-aspartate) O-methyltransferase
MVLEENEELIEHLKSLGALKSKTLEEAIRKFPRHKFIPKLLRQVAYDDMPLRIDGSQTISQPLVVAIMTEALEIKWGNKVLEVGTGSGWQAALLSYLVGDKGRVYTIEILEELFNMARENLREAGARNVNPMLGDGSIGFDEEAPFDRIIVTAAAPKIPEALIEQLKPNGILVAPVGDRIMQKMFVVKKKDNRIEKISFGEFAFVPLTGKYGFKR